jgi:hypothetical protein
MYADGKEGGVGERHLMAQEERAESVARDWLTGWLSSRSDRQSYASLRHIRRQSSQLHGNLDTQSSVPGSCGTLTAARTTLNASLFPQFSISYDKPNGTAIWANIINKCGCNFQKR